MHASWCVNQITFCAIL